MRNERLYFNEMDLCPIHIKGQENKHLAYLFNLSEGGLCFVTPKFFDTKIGEVQADYNVGEKIKLDFSPLRAKAITCKFEIKHSYEDEHYHYFGGEFQSINQEDQESITKELSGVKKRRETKKAPYQGALWMMTATSLFYVLLTSFQL